MKFESELAIVIGKEAKNVPEFRSVGLRVRIHGRKRCNSSSIFSSGRALTIGKSFDTFTPLGPVIETELDPFAVNVEARLNGVETQNSATEL